MPRDIRSYFQSSKPNSSASSVKTTKRRVISSDEDDITIQSPAKRTKKTKKGGRISDSDEDNIKQQKVVSPAAFLSGKPLKRQEAPKTSKQLQKEAKSHNDDDFEATLSQLDTSNIEQKYLAENKSDSDSFKEVTHESEKIVNVREKKTPVKKNLKINDKKKELKNEIHVSSKLNEDVEHKAIVQSSKSKQTKKNSETKSDTHKMEIVHKEVKTKSSPKKAETDVYEEISEKRKQHSAMYQQYLQRGGAKKPGSKEIPVGADNCLAGLSFLITGVLDSLEREEAEELIKKYGGRILHQVSKKTDYVIVGDQPGPAKMSKANSLNITEISEDDLLEMIRTKEAVDVKESHVKSKGKVKKKSTESEGMSPSPPKKAKIIASEEVEKLKKKSSPHKAEQNDNNTEQSLKLSPEKIKANNTKLPETTNVSSPNKKIQSPSKEHVKSEESIKKTNREMIDEKTIERKLDISYDVNGNALALVEKYRPKTMKQILGQQGDKSCAKKLYTWLMNWHRNQSGQVKLAKPSPWAKNDDGAFFKAALLSGPPGIGKTTTAQVICNELGFDLIEFNASDTRSKKLLQAEVSKLISNTTLKDYFADNKSKPTQKHVLLMDEVDGMAGNEDRGGLQELIGLIKSTDIPIICICNDRNNPKMRTLANYTFDLRFLKPRLEQIRGAMKSICFKEKIDISIENLDRLIESTNHDIRQVINHLALFIGQIGTQEKSDKKHVNKDLKLGPWDVAKKVFSAEEHKSMSIHDKSDLFFHDYSIAPLFVQENYILVVPQGPKDQLLEKVAQSAESLALGDVVEKSIRSSGAWSLLPMQACYSSVIPGTVMSGHISGQINFPSWLGRNSKANKFDRLIQEITVHARLATGASKEAINLDYLKPLRNSIVRPLAVDGTSGVEAAMNVMNYYHLLRDDLDSLIEVSLWPEDRDPMQIIDSKVKAAFTRAYNKNSVAVPYTVGTTSKKKAPQSVQDQGFLDEEAEEELNSDENEDSVEVDKMIKAKKPTASKKTESKKKSSDKSEGKHKTSDKSSKRGRGRGKAQ